MSEVLPVCTQLTLLCSRCLVAIPPLASYHSSSWLWTLLPELSPSSAWGAAFTQAPQQRDTGIMTPLSRAASMQAPPTTDTFPTADLQGRIHHEEPLRTFSFIFPLWNSHLSFLKFKFCYDKMSVKKKAALVISWQKSFSIMAPWRKGKVSFFPLIKSWSLGNGSVVVCTVMSVTFVSQLFLFFSVLNLEQHVRVIVL